MPFKARKSVFEKLESIVDIAALSKEERLKYDESIKIYRDSLAVMSFARKERLEEGMEKGLQKGLEEGIEKGAKEGREEERIKNARCMKAEGIPTELIAKITDLPLEAIVGL